MNTNNVAELLNGIMRQDFLRKLVELASAKKGKHPFHIKISDLRESPVYQHPEKWSNNYCIMPRSNRIDTYKPLDQSVFGISSVDSPRMTYFSRIVVPKTFLTPMTLYKNDIKADQDAMPASEFLLGPLTTKKHLEEDPIFYYPIYKKLFEDIGKSLGKAEINKVPRVFYQVSSSKYITQNMDAAWVKKTTQIMEILFVRDIKKQLDKLVDSYNLEGNSIRENTIVLDFSDPDRSQKLIYWYNDQTIICVKYLLIDYPDISTKLGEYLGISSSRSQAQMEVNDGTCELILSLYRLALFNDH